MIGKGLIEVVDGGRLRVSVTLDNGKRRYASFTRFVNEKYGERWTAASIRKQFTDKQLHRLALECQAALAGQITEEQERQEQEQEKRRERAERQKRGGNKLSPDMAIGRWINVMLRRRRSKGVKDKSLLIYAVAGRLLIRAAGGWTTPLNSLPPDFGHDLLDRLNRQDPELRGVIRSKSKTKPWSSTTIKTYIKHIRSYFTGAINQQLIKHDPFADVKVMAKKSRPEAVYISAEYAVELIDASLNRPSSSSGWRITEQIRTSWAAAIALGRFGGLRLSEIADLPVSRIDLDCRHNDVPTVVVRNNKTFDVAGNNREFRYVPIHEYLVGILRQRLECLPEGAQYVIGDGFIRASTSTYSRSGWLFKQLGRPRMSSLFQNCRRSYCRDLREQVPIDAYCEIVGHSAETAMKYYLATEARHRRAIAENIGPASGPLKMTGT